MIPVRTDTTNCILKGPTEDVQDLPVTRFTVNGTIPAVESCWALTPEELKQVIKSGNIYFSVYGNTHPPIYIGTESIAGGGE